MIHIFDTRKSSHKLTLSHYLVVEKSKVPEFPKFGNSGARDSSLLRASCDKLSHRPTFLFGASFIPPQDLKESELLFKVDQRVVLLREIGMTPYRSHHSSTGKTSCRYLWTAPRP